MNSIRCPFCNLTNWAEADFCKRCKGELKGSVPSSENSPYDNARHFQSVGAQQAYPNVQMNGLKTGLAIASMVIGIISIPTSMLLIGILLAPIAFVLGIVALRKASQNPFIYGGRGFAIAGIATSASAFLFIVPIIAAIAIPNLLAAKRAADEGSSMSNLRTLYGAEATYIATYGEGSCGDLKALVEKSLIKPEMATGIVRGYRYEVVMMPRPVNCEIFATPVSKTGPRSFMISTDGVLRGAAKRGTKAEKNDPPIGN